MEIEKFALQLVENPVNWLVAACLTSYFSLIANCALIARLEFKIFPCLELD